MPPPPFMPCLIAEEGLMALFHFPPCRITADTAIPVLITGCLLEMIACGFLKPFSYLSSCIPGSGSGLMMMHVHFYGVISFSTLS